MLELALKGSKKYYGWMTLLLGVIGGGFVFYLWQFSFGLGITGMSRDVSWGFYIAQFTFLVGVAASAVMVVLPYYLHDYKAFGRITILGEFLAVSSVTMCILFIFVDLGQPMRVVNVILYPTPNSVLFWDMIVLNGYLFLNIIVGWKVLEAERNGIAPPTWVKPLIYLSIPWAVSIHTVTAFLYYALQYAAFNGHLNVVKYLCQQGADIHANNDDAFRWSAYNGHLNVVKYLLTFYNHVNHRQLLIKLYETIRNKRMSTNDNIKNLMLTELDILGKLGKLGNQQ